MIQDWYKHLILFEDNTISQIFIFHTALIPTHMALNIPVSQHSIPFPEDRAAEDTPDPSGDKKTVETVEDTLAWLQLPTLDS